MAQEIDYNELVKDWHFETLKSYHEFLEEKGLIQKFPNHEEIIKEFVNQ